MGELPAGWVEATLKDIGEWGSGGTPLRSKPEFFSGGTIPWLKIGDLNDGVVSEAEERITALALENSTAKLLPPNVLLLAMYGSIGKLGITGCECATNQAIAFCHPHINLRYLFWFLRFSRTDLRELGKGGTQANISQGVIRDFAIPLAPFAEQGRIVDKVERLLARVSAAHERLTRLPAFVKRFRQSVLSAAYSGELTADWREGQTDDQPVGAGSRTLPDLPSRGEKVLPPSTAPQDSLPEHWKWHSIDELVQPGRSVGYGFVKPGRHDPQGIRVLKSGCINHRRVDTTEGPRISPLLDEQYRRTRLRGGEVLLNLVGASIGRSAIAPPEVCGWNVSRAIAVVPVRMELAHWVHLAIEGPAGQDLIQSKVGGSAQPVLNIEEVRSLGLPIPPEAERVEIVRRVEVLLRLAEKVESHAQAANARVERLPQAILYRAFTGELVPTESQLARAEGRSYETAGELLERIRTERAADVSPKRHKAVARRPEKAGT